MSIIKVITTAMRATISRIDEWLGNLKMAILASLERMTMPLCSLRTWSGEEEGSGNSLEKFLLLVLSDCTG